MSCELCQRRDLWYWKDLTKMHSRRLHATELRRCLPKDILDKLQELTLEEDLRKVQLDNLIRCPSCDFAAILSPSIKMLKCQNDSCNKTTCRKCQLDWKEHEGRNCEDLEKKDETNLRKDYEERMTAAKVRKCAKCAAQFMKDDGCNRMTCRCGAYMCYICREPDITYKHFCQHVRDPGHGCTQCSACSLWSNPEEDDERAVREIQREAEEKKKELGFHSKVVIGVPLSDKNEVDQIVKKTNDERHRQGEENRQQYDNNQIDGRRNGMLEINEQDGARNNQNYGQRYNPPNMPGNHPPRANLFPPREFPPHFRPPFHNNFPHQQQRFHEENYFPNLDQHLFQHQVNAQMQFGGPVHNVQRLHAHWEGVGRFIMPHNHGNHPHNHGNHPHNHNQGNWNQYPVFGHRDQNPQPMDYDDNIYFG